MVRAVLDVCGELAARGHKVVFLTADAADAPPVWKQGGPDLPQVVTVRTRRRRLRGDSMHRVDALLASTDVLHVHGPWDLGNLQLAAAARRRGVPYVLTLHGMLDDWSMAQKWLKKRLFLALVGRRFLARAARVHCTAESELTQSSRFLRPCSGVVIPYLVDLARWDQRQGAESASVHFPQLRRDQPRILFLSRLHPKKGAELLIAAAGKLQAEGLAFQLIIAGPGDPGYVAQLQQLVRDNGIESRVLFPGMVRGAAKIALYRACDVYVLPTSQENFGLVLIEALASEAPVITTRGVDIWQELQQAGATIVDRTPDAIAAAIKPFLSEPGGDEVSDRRRGRDYVLQWLAPDRVIGQYEAMYRAVIQTAGATAAARG